MYNRAFPIGSALFLFAGGVMSLFRLPCSKFSLPFLAVPAGKDGRVECPCQTVDDIIGVRGNVCGLFLFVQTHAPLIVPPWQSRARKSKFQFFIRRKNADVFHPAHAAGGSLMAYKCLSLCDFFIVQHGLVDTESDGCRLYIFAKCSFGAPYEAPKTNPLRDKSIRQGRRAPRLRFFQGTATGSCG